MAPEVLPTQLVAEVTDTPAQADLDDLGQHLSDFNDADVGPAQRRALVVFMRNPDGAIRAGLSGYTAWGWLYVQWLWVAEDQRGNDQAAKMLQVAEDEARQRGCQGAWIDTFSPVALKVYQRHGYAAFGALPDFPKGRTRTFLAKQL